MDILPSSRLQTVLKDRVKRPLHGAVKQELWRLNDRQPQVDIDGVALIGTNHSAVFAQREATFVIVGNDIEELIVVYRRAATVRSVE